MRAVKACLIRCFNGILQIKISQDMKLRLFNLVAAAILILTGCAEERMDTTQTMQWIAAYTPELIDQDSKIRIEPTQMLRQVIDPRCCLDEVFCFTPKVKGSAVFAEDGRFINFCPDEGELKQGQEYECRIDMPLLTGIDTLSCFSFNFRVLKREVKMCDVTVSIDPNDAEKAIVSGKLIFSYPAKLIHADPQLFKCSDKNAVADVKMTDEANVLDFKISNVKRIGNDYMFKVKYVSETLSETLSYQVSIPGLKEFKLLSATDVSSSEPYICLEFTSPLDPRQDLEGLISVDRCDIVRIERNGASVRVFYRGRGLARYTLCISDMVRSQDGCNLKSDIVQEFTQEIIPPAIKVPMSGSILPDGNNLIFPFRSVNLAAVDVEVVKIYSDNVLHFLQDNEIGDNGDMRRSGRLIYKRTVRLDEDKSLDLHQWQNFSINLSGMFRQERAAIYNIRLSFRKSYSLYDRTEPAEFTPVKGVTEDDETEWDKTYSYTYRNAPDFNWWEYSWRESDDPSKDSYYMESSRMPEYNLLATNLGIIVKKADNKRLWATVSDIMTAAPLSGVMITAYNYQLREVGSGRTDSRGFADFSLNGKPFIVTACDGISTSYLKVADGKENSVSLFDVSGKSNPGGIKGYVYGERGIWRPGDNIYLTLIVEDKENTLPSNHPVVMELYTPGDVLYDRQVLTRGVNGFYSFCTKTADDAQTGRWNAKFYVGGSVFEHKVQIETIKPNRLKVNVDIPETLSAESNVRAKIGAAWLTGSVARGLNTVLEATLYNNDKPFDRYPKYRFSNPLLNFSQSSFELGSGVLDSLGNVTLDMHLPTPENAPGMLQANLLCRVAEVGGDESVTSKSVRYSPFSSYVGIKLEQDEYETDTDLLFPVVTVDKSGNELSERNLEWKIYHLQWQWWWQGTAENLSRYVEGRSAEIVSSGTLVTKDGKAEIPFRVDYPSWGRYLVLVKDLESKHATGGVICVDWPQWRGRSDRDNSKGASVLSFTIDKNKYEVGETAQIYLPKSAGGKVLISIENGTRVISRHWASLSSGQETVYRLKVTKEMTPDFYVHATLLQPHSQTVNDLPVRLYGIQRAEVVDKSSILHPEIESPDEILPQKEFVVKVKERDGRPMTYTLAIVDEGLLDINGFRTPNAWRTMNMRQALGVSTWDIYDDVIGAYAGKFTSVLSIGGDEALRSAAGKEKRFNPVVMFMGPFTSDGSTRIHKVTLPMYVGSVRVMVVAAQDRAYGCAEKNMTVRSPLMLIPTLPRVLACGDKVRMPVNLFVTEEDVKDVEVSVSVEGPLEIDGSSHHKINFLHPGEKILDFALSCSPAISGMGKVTIKAASGSATATETVNIQVKNPHDVMVTSQQKVLGDGEEKFEWAPGENGKVTLEVSSMPSVNFEKVFAFTKYYSHYCTEQLSSRAMFLLYGRRFLSSEKQKMSEQMLREIIKEITLRQLPDGGFKYWSTSTSAHQWATSMAGEVLSEALNQGFAVPSATYQKWVDYQIAQSKKYKHSSSQAADLQQAYRLYTLVMAGNEQTASMNRLKESKTISEQAKYRLAAAYCIAGKRSVAEEVLKKPGLSTKGDNSTFWSVLRDDAMKLETLVLAGMIDEAVPLARRIASDFAGMYCTTQEVAFITPAFSRLSGAVNNTPACATVSSEGQSKQYRNISGIVTLDIPASAGMVTVRNEGPQMLYLSLVNEREPSAEEIIPSQSDGAGVSVAYTDVNGRPVDITALKQGDEVYADISVTKKDGLASDSMALTFKVPSGWELWNERIHNDVQTAAKMDIRDDRVCWYFRLAGTEKKSFRIKFRAAYVGEYILPSVVVEDMYSASCRACTASAKVIVSK